MIIRTDQIARYITEQLTSHGLIDRVNIVYLSDHGMDTVQSPNFIDLTALMTPDTFDIYSNTPVMQIVPRPGFTDQVLRELSEGARQNGHFRVYTAETLPERWNIGNAQRTGPITAVADVKYAFQDMWQLLEYYKKAFNISRRFSIPIQKRKTKYFLINVTFSLFFFSNARSQIRNAWLRQCRRIDARHLYGQRTRFRRKLHNGSVRFGRIVSALWSIAGNGHWQDAAKQWNLHAWFAYSASVADVHDVLSRLFKQTSRITIHHIYHTDHIYVYVLIYSFRPHLRLLDVDIVAVLSRVHYAADLDVDDTGLCVGRCVHQRPNGSAEGRYATRSSD